jgi:hypothetical protein
MTVVHFAKVSDLYPWVVIPSLAKRLEKPPFCHSYTPFGVWPRDHYMSLQRFTMCRMLVLAKVVRGTITLLRFSGEVRSTTAPLAPCEPRWVTTLISHSSEQDTLPITSLTSKQAIPYRTRGDTSCPRVSTPKTQSLAASSMTNHKPWRSQPSPPFQTLLKPQHQTSPWFPHITTDGRPTLSTQDKLNIIEMERLVWQLKTAGLSIATNHKHSILKYEGLGNQLMHAAFIC